MYDIHTLLPNTPGALGQFGTLLGQAGISLEGGGVFSHASEAHAHFLVAEGEAAKQVLTQAGLEVLSVTPVLIRSLKQEIPGQLGTICRTLGEAGINILTMYSDHANQLILVTDDPVRAEQLTTQWRP